MGVSAMRIAVVGSAMMSVWKGCGLGGDVDMGRRGSSGRGPNDMPRALVHRRAAGWLAVTLDLIKRLWVLGTATPQREGGSGGTVPDVLCALDIVGQLQQSPTMLSMVVKKWW